MSIKVKRTFSCTPFDLPSRALTRASAKEDVHAYYRLMSYEVLLHIPISSMKRIAGAAARARLKSSATALSESPTYGEKISAAEAERKAQPVPEAAARTSFVLPQPGGPYSRQP